MWTTCPLSPQAATKLTGLVLLSRASSTAALGSALGAPFSHLITELLSFFFSFQLLVLLRRVKVKVKVKDKRSLLAESHSASRGQWWWLLPLHEIHAGLAVSHASVAFYRDSFVLLTSCAGFRRPTVLPWQQFLLKYRWECKLILNKVKWRRGVKKLSQNVWSRKDVSCLTCLVR